MQIIASYIQHCHIQCNCMDKNFVPLFFHDFLQKISNFPDFSWSSNKFWLRCIGKLALVGGNSKFKNKDPSEGNTEFFFWLAVVRRSVITSVISWWSSVICVEYTYISEFILWLPQGRLAKRKWVKIPSLAPLQVSNYIKTVK